MASRKKGGPKRSSGRKKAEDVELLAGKTESGGATTKVAGPTVGEDAPLFGKKPDLGCSLGFADGCLYVEFDKALTEWELSKRQATFACDLIVSYARQLPATRRGAADAAGEDLDFGATLKRANGKLVVCFDKSTKRWKLSKLAAKLAVGHMRAELIAIPLLRA